MSSVPLAFPVARTVAARRALLFLFFVLGLIYASWAARIPAIRDAHGMDAATLTLVLLACGVGAVASFPLAAWLAAHAGARRSAWFAGIALLLSLPALAWAPELVSLMIVGVLYGAACSCFDVAINALGAELEKMEQRSIMSLLHAWFCVGTVSGALLGSAIAATGLAPHWHFSLLALMCAWPLWLAYRALPDDKPSHDPARRVFAIPHGPLVALGLIAFCGAIVEGSTADWSGIFMKDHLRVGDGAAPLAFAAFTATMLALRLTGDRLKDRFGARKVVTVGATVAALGMVLAALAVNMPMALIGFAMAGGGVAAVFPFVFSAAGRHGSSALAGVATLGYSGNLLGPPIIGMAVQAWGLQAAVAVIALLCAGVALAACRAIWLE